MPPGRSEPSDDDLLPNAETALEAAGTDTPAPVAAPVAALPRRRGRPPGSKNRPKPARDGAPVEASLPTPDPSGSPPAAAPLPTPTFAAPGPAASPVPAASARRRPVARAIGSASASAPRGDRLTIEQIVACDSPREPRLSPDGRRVAYTAEAGGARQVFILDLRSGTTRQLTASEKAVSDPQWAPDGAHLAYVRDDAIWVIGANGSRPTVVTEHPAGSRAPRWAPDSRRIAFVSRRRCLLYTSPSPRDGLLSRMPSSA